MSNHDHPAGALGDMARADDMRTLHSTGENHPHLKWLSAEKNPFLDDMIAMNIANHADGTGECHAPQPHAAACGTANIYDVLSRLYEAAKRLELPWTIPGVLVANNVEKGIFKEPCIIFDFAPNRRLDVAIVADGVVSAYLVVKHAGHYGDGGVGKRTQIVLTTPADYARAYRWLVTGEQA